MRSEEAGSAVVFIVFTIALLGGGFIYTQLDKGVNEIEDVVAENDILNVRLEPMSEDTTFNFYIWIWNHGVPIMILIMLIVWFTASMQKARYFEE
jgi:hypothetical protein